MTDSAHDPSQKLSHTCKDSHHPSPGGDDRYLNCRVERDFMQALTFKSDCAIAELFYQVSHSGNLTLTESHRLRVLGESALNQDDRDAVNRLLHAIRRGWVRISD
jgi:hypothetical protein